MKNKSEVNTTGDNLEIDTMKYFGVGDEITVKTFDVWEGKKTLKERSCVFTKASIKAFSYALKMYIGILFMPLCFLLEFYKDQDKAKEQMKELEMAFWIFAIVLFLSTWWLTINTILRYV